MHEDPSFLEQLAELITALVARIGALEAQVAFLESQAALARDTRRAAATFKM